MKLSFNPKDQLDAYVQTVNAHHLDQALALLAEDFRIQFIDYGSSMTKEEVRTALEWDAGTNGHISYEDLEVDGRRVSGMFTEVNDFLTLVGIKALKSRNTYVFDKQGLIREQLYERLPNQRSFQEAMQPAVEWAEQHRGDELAEIYPGNRMIYSREMAQRWVRLLREWRQDTGTSKG
ncbi:MAG TPA: nuclear transport factor 2 family protein [Rhodothermales bacterium]|nr:nuclear transport factor 2 family protein [Rhodothermales bacterium]